MSRFVPRVLLRVSSAILVSAVTAACANVSVTGVSTFSSSSGHFSVTVPGGMMDEQQMPGSGHYDGTMFQAFTNIQPNGTRFAVLTADATDGYPTASQVEEALDGMEAANVGSTGGTQTADRQLTIAGLPGREQEIVSSSASYVFRLVFSGTRAYSISVTGTDAAVHEAMSKVFLDSFAILP